MRIRYIEQITCQQRTPEHPNNSTEGFTSEHFPPLHHEQQTRGVWKETLTFGSEPKGIPN